MPTGIHVEHDGRYRAMYSYLEKNYALLDYESEPIPTNPLMAAVLTPLFTQS